MTKFQFFKFPILVIEEIVRSLDPVEKIHIAVLSQRAKRLMKSIKPKMSEDYQMMVELGSRCVIWFFNQNNPTERLTLHSNLWNAHEEIKRIDMAQQLTNNVWDTFGNLISHVSLEMDMENGACRNAMFNWASQKKEKLESIQYVGTVSPDERVSQFLHEFMGLRIVRLKTNDTGNFLNENMLEFNEFHYYPGPNVPRQMILTQLSAERLYLTSITNEDLNLFFKKYLQEDDPEGFLKQVTIQVNNRNLNIIFDQIAAVRFVVEDDENIEYFKIRHPNGVDSIEIFIDHSEPDLVKMEMDGNILPSDVSEDEEDEGDDEEEEVEEEEDEEIEE